MNILGIDPSMSNCGFVLVELNPTNMKPSVIEMKLVETEKSKNKQTRKSCDDISRAKEIIEALQRYENLADIVVAEVPHGSQSANGMKSYGMCCAILAGIKKPLIQLSDQQVKKCILGVRSATKQQMIDWAFDTQPEAPWLLRGGRLLNKNEHLADAYAAIETAIKSDEFKLAMTFKAVD